MLVSTVVHLEIVDGMDVGSRRAAFEFGPQPREHDVASLGSDFDGPIGPIAYPSCQSKPSCRFTNEPAKPDALHAATYENVNARHVLPPPLSSPLHPYDPSSGTKRTGAMSCCSICPFFRWATISFCSSRSPTGMSSRPPSAN